jgi:hypothetical protein
MQECLRVIDKQRHPAPEKEVAPTTKQPVINGEAPLTGVLEKNRGERIFQVSR